MGINKRVEMYVKENIPLKSNYSWQHPSNYLHNMSPGQVHVLVEEEKGTALLNSRYDASKI